MPFLKVLTVCHAGYILVTAIWPIVHIESFMFVTGPKTDIWLVKTVGALLIPVGLTMLCLFRISKDHTSLILLATGTAIAFMIIDIYYAVNDVISDIYLLDAGVEFLFLIGWVRAYFTLHSNSQTP
jgi:hypothetical protein